MDLTMHTRPEGVATEGSLVVGAFAFFTLEHAAVQVPAGTYALVPYLSPTHGATWCLENEALGVTAGGRHGTRSRCEIHSANWAEQLEGCVALGLDDKPMLNPATGRVEPAVEHSGDAVKFLHTLLGSMSTGHTLTIDRGDSNGLVGTA